MNILVKSLLFYLEGFQRYGVLKMYNFLGHPVYYTVRNIFRLTLLIVFLHKFTLKVTCKGFGKRYLKIFVTRYGFNTSWCLRTIEGL